MTNLMQFQKAYEASAELISTVNEMLQTLVNMKTS
jgi:flagellar hook-associated protein FlgK